MWVGSKLWGHGGQRGPRAVGLGKGQTGGFKEQQKVHVCSARVMGSEVAEGVVLSCWPSRTLPQPWPGDWFKDRCLTPGVLVSLNCGTSAGNSRKGLLSLLWGCKGAGLRIKSAAREAGPGDRKMDAWRHNWVQQPEANLHPNLLAMQANTFPFWLKPGWIIFCDLQTQVFVQYSNIEKFYV